MSHPWWEKDARDVDGTSESRRLILGEFGLKRPQLHTQSTREIANELRKRRPSFTPDWIDPADRDAGGALVELFANQLATVARRVNRLPDKALVEFLDLAGIQAAPARPATAMVQFTVSQAAVEPILIPKGFQIGARPAGGSGDLVVFETLDSQFMAPAEIKHLLAATQSSQTDLSKANEDPTSSFAPFGERPGVGDALLLGLSVPLKAQLKETISFGIRVASAPGNPPPISAGGVVPIALPAAPVLRWEVLVNSAFQPAEVDRDETSSLWRSGIVTLRIPPGLNARRFIGTENLFWFRLRLIHGNFEKPPRLNFFRVNMARVEAIRTMRDEVLEPIGDPTSNQMRLKNTPVVPNRLVLEVDQSVFSDSEADDQSGVRQWKEVDELFSYGPHDEVFTVDPSTGIVSFGDGKHGAIVPPGFRNVRAVEYKVGSGAESAVHSNEIKTLLNSAAFLNGVTNPLPASGGVGNESQKEAIRRGPETIRCRNRSVTVADYAVMANFAPGADVRRAHAISGYHALFPGQHIPGVVGVLVVPKVDEIGPPIPDEQALRAVSQFLTTMVAPIGVEIVAASPKFRNIRAEVGFIARRGADISQTIRNLSDEVDRFLHPLTGGDNEEGWPFGGTLLFSELLQRLLTRVEHILAIQRLRLIVDGVPQKSCGDVTIRETELFWPIDHQVIPLDSEDNK